MGWGYSLLGVLSFFFIGLSMYMPICGIVLGEMNIFIEILPEGKAMAAISATAFSVANIAPILLLVLLHYKTIGDWIIVAVLEIIAVVDLFLLACCWKWQENGLSIGLVLFSVIGGVIGTTCVLVVFNVAAPFKPQYTSAVSAGLSGAAIVTSLLALIQKSVVFSVTVYFLVLASLMPFAITGLLLVKTQWLRSKLLREMTNDDYGSIQYPNKIITKSPLKDRIQSMSKPLISMFISSCTNFLVMPSMFPFIASTNNRLVTLTFLYSVSNFLGRVLCSVPFVHSKCRQLYIWTGIQVVCFVYMTVRAVVGIDVGGWILLLAVMCAFSVLNGFIVTESLIVAHEESSQNDTEWSVRATSAMLQLGNALGGPIALGLVYLGVFT